MKKNTVVMFLVGLSFASYSVKANGSCSAVKGKTACKGEVAKSTYKKISLAPNAVKFEKRAKQYKKLAKKMLTKGDKIKAAYYTKLVAIALKMAKACKNDDMKALMLANNEYLMLTKNAKAKKK